jgi:phosphatidylglycerophosphatase C
MKTLHSAGELLAALDLKPGAWAATDADGTLWAADVAELCWDRVLSEGLMRSAAAAPMAAELTQAGGTSSGDVHDDARALFELYASGRTGDIPILKAMAFCYAGWSEPELRAFASELAQKELAPHVYATTRELLRGLIESGVRLAVVSGSPQVVVEEAVAMLDLGAVLPVRGMVLGRSGQTLTAKIGEPLTWYGGKVEALGPVLNGAPLAAAFGDTTGDQQLLDSAEIAVLVHPRPSLRDHANASPGTWIEFAPRQTADGRSVAPPGGGSAL